MQQVKEDSRASRKWGREHGSLDGMIAAGLVVAGLVVNSDTRDPRRIYHKLMARGQATLKAESERLSAVAATARPGNVALWRRLRGIPFARIPEPPTTSTVLLANGCEIAVPSSERAATAAASANHGAI
jgi:hypothetical protein